MVLWTAYLETLSNNGWCNFQVHQVSTLTVQAASSYRKGRYSDSTVKSRQARINVTPPELLVLWQYIRRHLTSVTPSGLMVLWQHIWRHLATTVDVTFQVHQGSTLTVQAASSYRIGSTLTVQATPSDRKESTLTVRLAAQSNTIQLKQNETMCGKLN